MKSLKIAALGVAALGFAALPVAGAFAADNTAVTSHIDKLAITVDQSCTLGSMTSGAYDDSSLQATDQTEHASGDYDNPKTTEETETLGGWTKGTPASGVRTDTLTITMQPGTESANIGSTTFTVRCNNASGYMIQAQASAADLAKSGSSAVIPGAAAFSGNSYWNFKLSDASVSGMTIVDAYKTAGAVPTTATTVAYKTTAGNTNAGETVKVTYGAGISKSQESGTYEGSVTYTLVSPYSAS